jgi:hypothetical protein
MHVKGAASSPLCTIYCQLVLLTFIIVLIFTQPPSKAVFTLLASAAVL